MVAAVLELERINGISAARKKAHAANKDEALMSTDGFGEIGFTEKDREALIKATLVLGEVEKKLDKYELRFERIERERVSKEESDRIAKTLADKVAENAITNAKTETALTKEITTLSVRLSGLEKQVWKWIAWTGGACTSVAFILKMLKIL